MTKLEKLAKLNAELTQIRYATHDTNEAGALLAIIGAMIESYDPEEYIISPNEMKIKVAKVLNEYNEKMK